MNEEEKRYLARFIIENTLLYYYYYLNLLQLLYHATNIFRTQHFVRQDKVREEIGKKVRALKALKTHLLKELDTLTETKMELRQTAERLAERYEDIKDKQKQLARR